jgi:hypothetical protein
MDDDKNIFEGIFSKGAKIRAEFSASADPSENSPENDLKKIKSLLSDILAELKEMNKTLKKV